MYLSRGNIASNSLSVTVSFLSSMSFFHLSKLCCYGVISPRRLIAVGLGMGRPTPPMGVTPCVNVDGLAPSNGVALPIVAGVSSFPATMRISAAWESPIRMGRHSTVSRPGTSHLSMRQEIASARFTSAINSASVLISLAFPSFERPEIIGRRAA